MFENRRKTQPRETTKEPEYGGSGFGFYIVSWVNICRMTLLMRWKKAWFGPMPLAFRERNLPPPYEDVKHSLRINPNRVQKGFNRAIFCLIL